VEVDSVEMVIAPELDLVAVLLGEFSGCGGEACWGGTWQMASRWPTAYGEQRRQRAELDFGCGGSGKDARLRILLRIMWR